MNPPPQDQKSQALPTEPAKLPDYVILHSSRDLANVIKVPNQLTLSTQKRWSDQELDEPLKAVKEVQSQTGSLANNFEDETRMAAEFCKAERKRTLPAAAKLKRSPQASDEMTSPAVALIADLWYPEQRTPLSPACTSDLEETGKLTQPVVLLWASVLG